MAPGSFSSPPVPQTHQPLSHWAPALNTYSGVRAFELEGLPGYMAHLQFPDSPLLKESFHDQSHCHPPSLLSRPLPFLLSSTSDYLTCSMYFSVDSLSATLKMSSPGRKVLSPYPTPCLSPAQRSGLHLAGRCSVPPVSSTGARPGLSREVLSPYPLPTAPPTTHPPGPISSTEVRPALGREVLSPLPSPAQRTGQDSGGRCSVPSRLQHRGQACTRQGSAQSLPTAPISSIEVRPAFSREVLSPLPSPAQRPGLHSANAEQMHQH